MNLTQQILAIFNKSTTKYLSQKQIYTLVDAHSVYERNVVSQALMQLVAQGDLVYDKRNSRYSLQPKEQLIKGQIDGNARGFAFLVVDGEENDFFIAPNKLHGALHKDIVLARRLPHTKDEVEVVKVLSRGVTQIVGTYDKANGGRFVVSDDKKFFKDVYIPPKKDMGAKDGQKVVAKINVYPTDANLKPEGEIVQILGYAGQHVADMLSVAYAFGIRTDFDDKVTKWANKVATITDADYVGRTDFRDDFVITIDGADAKDLDDAISCTCNADGTFNLAVHIADVSHYVKPGGDIDNEAFLRGTSVYLPEIVFPMLPPVLSNGVCSLFCGEDRLTLSCVMRVDCKGNVVDFQVVKGVINSKRRTTYDQVQAILDGEPCDQPLRQVLLNMQQLAKVLISKRQRRGNVNFESKEVKFVMQGGKVVDIVPRKQLFAHQIIEEFMILANETVAEYANNCEVPFVYRVHDEPDSEKVAVLLALLKGLGVTIKETQSLHTTSLAKALDEVRQTPYFNLVNDVMLRTMQKAKYSETNTGHFGLASNCYCHFTSPIRRYPDLVVHRVLSTLIDGKMTQKAMDAYEEMCQVSSVQASKTEKIADEAERKAEDIKKCQFALTLVDQPLQGIVSGVTENGIFVQLENTVEGFVSSRLLANGTVNYIKEKFTLVCPHRSYSLGDRVMVKIYSVNVSACKIDMMLIDG